MFGLSFSAVIMSVCGAQCYPEHHSLYKLLDIQCPNLAHAQGFDLRVTEGGIGWYDHWENPPRVDSLLKSVIVRSIIVGCYGRTGGGEEHEMGSNIGSLLYE